MSKTWDGEDEGDPMGPRHASGGRQFRAVFYGVSAPGIMGDALRSCPSGHNSGGYYGIIPPWCLPSNPPVVPLPPGRPKPLKARVVHAFLCRISKPP